MEIIIKDFGVHIDSYRGSTTQIIGNRFSNASRTANGTAIVRLQGTDEGAGTYTPGGGMHIVDNEIAGERDDSSGEVNYTEAIFLVHTVDGLYLGRNHMTGYRYALKVEPLATAENHVVTDIISEQEYFDDPSHIAVNPYVVYLTGTAGYAGSMYQDMKFTNDYFRASSLPTLSAGTNALRVSIADAGDFASSGKKVKNFSVLGGTIRQAKDTGVVVAGSGAGKLEVYALAIQNVAFADNNAGGEASTSAMAIEAENVVITGNNFAPDANPSNRLIQLTTSDAASNMPSLIVTDNDFSFSNYAPDAAEIPYNNSPIRYSVNPNARVELSHNLFAGSGKSIDQVYRRKTSNASDVSIYEYSIPRDSNGIIKITLAGSSSDGDDRAAYEWSGMFYRNEGTDSGWSVPINTLSSYSSGGIQASLVTPISDNIIQVRISGADNTDVDWTAHVELLGSH